MSESSGGSKRHVTQAPSELLSGCTCMELIKAHAALVILSNSGQQDQEDLKCEPEGHVFFRTLFPTLRHTCLTTGS